MAHWKTYDTFATPYNSADDDVDDQVVNNTTIQVGAGSGLAVCAVWLDASDDIIDPGTLGSRGTYSLRIVEVAKNRDTGKTAVLDGEKRTGISVFERLVFGALQNTTVMLEVTSASAPGGDETQLQIWYQELI